MYLRYKIIFWSLMAVVLFGLGYLVWTRMSSRAEEEPPPMPPPEDVIVPDVFKDDAPNTTDTNQNDAVRPPFESPEVLRLLETGQEQLKNGSHAAARTLAWKAIEHGSVEEFDTNWLRAVEIVSQAHTLLANSTAPDPEKFMYRVRTGDSLARIAREQGTTVGALQRANQLDPTSSTIYENQVLYMYKGEWSLTVVRINMSSF